MARGQPQKINDVPEGAIVEKLLEIPKLTVEPGFKNGAPLQKDELAKDLIQEALKNPICISSDVTARARPGYRGLGSAFVAQGFKNHKPKPWAKLRQGLGSASA